MNVTSHAITAEKCNDGKNNTNVTDLLIKKKIYALEFYNSNVRGEIIR
jgi:hypothetical protein